MKRRFYALMLVVAMLAMTLVGCGSNTTNEETNASNETETKVENTEDVVVEEVVEEQLSENVGPNTFIKIETYNVSHGYSEELRQFHIDMGGSVEAGGVEPDVHTWVVSSKIEMTDSVTGDVITQSEEKTKEQLEENADFYWVSDISIARGLCTTGELEKMGGDTQTLTINGKEYIFEIKDYSIEGNYDDSKDCVMTYTFEGTYYTEGNEPNSSAQSQEIVVEAIEEPTEEVVEEPVSEIEETENPKSYSTMTEYVYSEEAANGISIMNCKIFEYRDDKTQGTVETTVNVSGFEFILSFDGDATLGTKSVSNSDGTAGFLYNKDKTQWLQIYTSGRLSQETFNQYMNGDLKEHFAWANVDEYFEETKEDNYVSAIVATTTMISGVEYKGYARVIIDLEKGAGTHLWYLVPSDVYDEQAVYNTIASAKIISEDESLISLFSIN